jgi:hypothetical protein
MRKSLVWMGVLCGLLVFEAFSQGGAQTDTPTPDYALTATRIIEIATATAKVIDSPTPIAGLEQTLTVAHVTRTAIALTRDPSLAISPTPNAIQLTATRVLMELRQTQAAYSTPAPGTIRAIELTVTEVIRRATTGALGDIPPATSDLCRLSGGNFNQEALSNAMEAALEEVGLEVWDTTVITFALAMPIFCNSPYYPLQTSVWIGVKVSDVTDFGALSDQTAAILSVLKDFPPTEDFGPEQTRLIIAYFVGENTRERQLIDTGYANALAAYEEGLRGEALLEALGGLLPIL